MLSRALVLSAATIGLTVAQTASACHGCGRPVAPCVPMVPQTVTTYCNVTETVIDRVEVTVMKTKFRTEYVPVEVPVTRCVVEEIPVTKLVTKVHKVTDYVPAPVKHCGHKKNRCGGGCEEVRMVPVTRCVPEQVEVTAFVKRPRKVTETVTRMKPVRVAEEVPVTVTKCVPRKVVRQVPVTKTVMVPATYAAAPVASYAAPQALPTGQSGSPQG